MTQRLRAWLPQAGLAVRHHYMLGATAAVLALAAAGGLGYFDEPASPAPQAQSSQSQPEPPVFVQGPPRTPVPVRAFEFNVFLVSTPEQQRALQTAENLTRSPYLLGGRASEVLLVLTAEDELYAAHHLEEIRMSFPGANVVVTDLR